MMQTHGIVAFEIEIEEIQAKKKISQNRDKKNFDNIISALQNIENPQAKAIANEMLKCKK